MNNTVGYGYCPCLLLFLWMKCVEGVGFGSYITVFERSPLLHSVVYPLVMQHVAGNLKSGICCRTLLFSHVTDFRKHFIDSQYIDMSKPFSGYNREGIFCCLLPGIHRWMHGENILLVICTPINVQIMRAAEPLKYLHANASDCENYHMVRGRKWV